MRSLPLKCPLVRHIVLRDLPFSLSETAFEDSLVLYPVFPPIQAEPIWFSFRKSTLVEIAIRKLLFAFAVFETIREVSWVDVTSLGGESSNSLKLVAVPVAWVVALIFVENGALTWFGIAVVLAWVGKTAGDYLEAFYFADSAVSLLAFADEERGSCEKGQTFIGKISNSFEGIWMNYLCIFVRAEILQDLVHHFLSFFIAETGKIDQFVPNRTLVNLFELLR